MPEKAPPAIGISSSICGDCMERQYRENNMLTESRAKMINGFKKKQTIRDSMVSITRINIEADRLMRDETQKSN